MLSADNKLLISKKLCFSTIYLANYKNFSTLGNLHFSNFVLEITSLCQKVLIQIRPDILSCLIWVQPVFKGYQQIALVKICLESLQGNIALCEER